MATAKALIHAGDEPGGFADGLQVSVVDEMPPGRSGCGGGVVGSLLPPAHGWHRERSCLVRRGTQKVSARLDVDPPEVGQRRQGIDIPSAAGWLLPAASAESGVFQGDPAVQSARERLAQQVRSGIGGHRALCPVEDVNLADGGELGGPVFRGHADERRRERRVGPAGLGDQLREFGVRRALPRHTRLPLRRSCNGFNAPNASTQYRRGATACLLTVSGYCDGQRGSGELDRAEVNW
ncbi:hypothetical protein ACFQ9X_31465 [Catenulispora yoronensis]